MWRNWQLRKRALPVGEKASLRRRRNKENCEQREQGDYVTSRLAGRDCPEIKTKYADVAELADALDSGSSESNFIWVQVPSSAPYRNNTNPEQSRFVFFFTRDYFGVKIAR